MTDSKKKLLMFAGDVGGVSYYRLILPAWVIGSKGEYLTHVSMILDAKKIAWNPTTIVFSRQYKPEVREFMNIWKKQGKRLIYETDDNLSRIPTYNPTHKYFTKEIIDDTIKTMKLCDVVTVSTEPLREFYSSYHPNVVVLPNNMIPEFLGKEPPPNKKFGEIRIGWAGSQTHSRDFNCISSAILEIASKYPQVKFVFFNWAPPDVEKALPQNQIMFVPGVSIDKYHKELLNLNLDIGLAPLEDNTFNRGKSNLKVLEYGLLGVPTIASPVYPYSTTINHEVDGMLAAKNKHKKWVSCMEKLINNSEMRLSLGRNIRKRVYDEFNLFRNIHLWEKTYFPEDFE